MTLIFLQLPTESKKKDWKNLMNLIVSGFLAHFLISNSVNYCAAIQVFFYFNWKDHSFPAGKNNRRKQHSLHFRENVIQLWSRADVAEKHVVDLRSEIFWWDGVTLWHTTAIMVTNMSHLQDCKDKMLKSATPTRRPADTGRDICHTTLRLPCSLRQSLHILDSAIRTVKVQRLNLKHGGWWTV